MFEINSCVLYGSNGVCKIVEKKKQKLFGDEKEYYVLSPLSEGKSVIYVPCDNELLLSKMKRILTKEEVLDIIIGIKNIVPKWEKDSKKRSEICNSILAGGDRQQIVAMIHSLYVKRRELQDAGKHLGSYDGTILRKAEKILNDEFSLSLGIPSDEVPAFIRDTLAATE